MPYVGMRQEQEGIGCSRFLHEIREFPGLKLVLNECGYYITFVCEVLGGDRHLQRRQTAGRGSP